MSIRVCGISGSNRIIDAKNTNRCNLGMKFALIYYSRGKISRNTIISNKNREYFSKFVASATN